MEILGIEIPTWVLVVGVILLTLVWWVEGRVAHFRQQGVKGPLVLPFVGTSYLHFYKGMKNQDWDVTQQYGRVALLVEHGKPTLLTTKEDLMKQILLKDAPNFINRFGAVAQTQLYDPVMRFNLLRLKDAEWKRVRSLLTPTFSTGKIRDMTSQITECAELLCKNLDNAAEQGVEFEAKSYCGAFTMDSIAKIAFGIEVDSQKDPNDDFVKYAQMAMDFKLSNPALLVTLFCPPLIPLVCGLGGYMMMNQESIRFFGSVTDQLLSSQEKMQGDGTKRSFIRLMIDAHHEENEPNDEQTDDTDDITANIDDVTPKTKDSDINTKASAKKGLTRTEVLAQGILFFLAGYDTTATTLSFLMYSMACNQELQEKLHQEVFSVSEKQGINYSSVNDMEYLDRCIQESLRLYPPAHRIDRVASNDVTIGNLHIPAGTVVAMPIHTIHRDPEYWPNPEEFDPDRFLPEVKQTRPTWHYLPFGLGPRKCIGMRLALLEVKLAAARIFHDFRILTNAQTQIPVTFKKMGLLNAERGLWLTADKR